MKKSILLECVVVLGIIAGAFSTTLTGIAATPNSVQNNKVHGVDLAKYSIVLSAKNLWTLHDVEQQVLSDIVLTDDYHIDENGHVVNSKTHEYSADLAFSEYIRPEFLKEQTIYTPKDMKAIPEKDFKASNEKVTGMVTGKTYGSHCYTVGTGDDKKTVVRSSEEAITDSRIITEDNTGEYLHFVDLPAEKKVVEVINREKVEDIMSNESIQAMKRTVPTATALTNEGETKSQVLNRFFFSNTPKELPAKEIEETTATFQIMELPTPEDSFFSNSSQKASIKDGEVVVEKFGGFSLTAVEFK